MQFTKMHGAGNDYVYVDCFSQPMPEQPAALARRISDRHFGVGGDGLILICPSAGADARMRMFNADGSEAEMCGNGVRCVAKYIYDHGVARKETLRIETSRGVLTLNLDVAGGRARRVRVDMGEPILDPARIPVDVGRIGNPSHSSEPFDRIVDCPVDSIFPQCAPSALEDCRLDLSITCVSMGNPHAVLYCGNLAAVPLERLGPHLEQSSIFPSRANVHFVQVQSPREVIMRTWERGSGITLACGTGACAVCVAGALTGRTERKILTRLSGGDLELEWAPNNHVYMTGPAVEVFSGEWRDV
jgi:diaminopimelate epimerase